MSKELILLMDPPQEVTERVAPEKTLQDSVLERWQVVVSLQVENIGEEGLG